MDSQVERNINGYRYVIQIEVGLREFVIRSFDLAFPKINWFSDEYDIIPQKKLDNARLERERSIEKGWDAESAENIHGIYFLLLTDLKDIIFKKYKRNNEDVNVFQLNRNQLEAVCGSLQSIFPIRNKIAHSVYISDIEIQALDSYLSLLHNLISDFESLIRQPEIRKKKEAKLLEMVQESCDLMSNQRMLDVNMINEIRGIAKSISLTHFGDIVTIIEDYHKLSKMTGSSVKLKNLIEDNTEELKKFKA